MARLLPLFMALTAMLACGGDDIIYQEKQTVSNGLWSYDRQYGFTFDIADTTALYLLVLTIEHTNDYDWENFYAEIETHFPGDSVQTDVISFELANPAGMWYGKCRGNTCQIEILLQERVRFPMTGTYTLNFEQYMRVDPVEGIRSLELKVVRPDSESK
jgi:gliding motility-associated lipoprotein GldH